MRLNPFVILASLLFIAVAGGAITFRQGWPSKNAAEAEALVAAMQVVEDGNTTGADHYRFAIQGERLGAQLGGGPRPATHPARLEPVSVGGRTGLR